MSEWVGEWVGRREGRFYGGGERRWEMDKLRVAGLGLDCITG